MARAICLRLLTVQPRTRAELAAALARREVPDEAAATVLGRFTEDLTALQRAIRTGDGDKLFDLFTRTRAIRRSIVEQGQDDARPDFGRSDHES